MDTVNTTESTPPTLEAVKAAAIRAHERAGSSPVLSVLRAYNAKDKKGRPSLKFLSEASYADALAALDAIPASKQRHNEACHRNGFDAGFDAGWEGGREYGLIEGAYRAGQIAQWEDSD